MGLSRQIYWDFAKTIYVIGIDNLIMMDRYLMIYIYIIYIQPEWGDIMHKMAIGYK